MKKIEIHLSLYQGTPPVARCSALPWKRLHIAMDIAYEI